MSNAVHLGKRAFGSVDHFLTSHGQAIKRFTEAAQSLDGASDGPDKFIAL